jgi:hypothetical protein
MTNIWKISRTTLISIARTLLLRADEARLVPELLPWLQSAEAQLAQLTASHNTAEVESHDFAAQSLVAHDAESDMDRQVIALCHRLRGESQARDAVATVAMRLLFPKGSTDLTKFGGRSQLPRYNAFAERLNIAVLPAQMTGSAVQILTALQTFEAALNAREQAHLRWKTALHAAMATDQDLRRTLTLLDRIACRSRAASTETPPDTEGGAT